MLNLLLKGKNLRIIIGMIESLGELPMNCLFCKIATGEIPAVIVFEDDELLAFRDVNPQAPVHVLIIPKRHIATINDTQVDDEKLLGRMVETAKNIAQTEGFNDSGYRLVFNVNGDGGQTVHHIHLHILAGRQMAWPPG